METVENFSNQGMNLIMQFSPKLVGAILVWIIGSWVIKAITSAFKKRLEKRNIDGSLEPFLGSLVSSLMKVMLVLSVLGTLGIEMTSFVAILGAAGLAVGMALSGTLQNFAVRAWVNAADYWGVFFDMNENVYKPSIKKDSIFLILEWVYT